MIINSLKIKSILIILLVLSACNQKKDPVTGKVIRQETNVNKKVENAPSLLFNKDKNKGTNYEFATSNILWRASLNSIDFMPLANVSYSGGVITTDWYSSNNVDESIKINIRFLSNELKVSSIQVDTFNRKCEKNSEKCKITKNQSNLREKIKDKIITEAKRLETLDKVKN